jgi:hypothetical protein
MHSAGNALSSSSAAREVFFYNMRSVFSGDTSPDTFLTEMDEAFRGR